MSNRVKDEPRRAVQIKGVRETRVFRLERRRAVRYRLSVALTAIFSWLIWLTPPPIRRRVANLGGRLFYRFAPAYRENVKQNLRHILRDRSEDEIDVATRSICRQSAQNFLDLFLIPHVDRHSLVHQDPLIEGSWSYLDDALGIGKGAIIMTAHLGPFDYIMQYLHQRGYRMTSVTGRTTSRFVFDGVTWLRRRNNAEVVEASPSGVRKVFQALKRGECAAFLGDYDFSGTGLPVTMFGSPTTLPQGPVRIARDTGAPIVPLFSRRIGNKHALILLPSFIVEKTRDIEADLKIGLQRMVESLEYGIGRNPDQWVMFQQMWDDEPAQGGDASPQIVHLDTGAATVPTGI
jgi:KDO2-lipid IV(A) lauroyltransferase